MRASEKEFRKYVGPVKKFNHDGLEARVLVPFLGLMCVAEKENEEEDIEPGSNSSRSF